MEEQVEVELVAAEELQKRVARLPAESQQRVGAEEEFREELGHLQKEVHQAQVDVDSEEHQVVEVPPRVERLEDQHAQRVDPHAPDEDGVADLEAELEE